MLAAVARLSVAAPRRIVAAALLLLIGTAVFAIPAASRLSAGGFLDPGSDSARASAMLADTFDQGDMELVVIVHSQRGAATGDARAVGTAITGELTASPFVSRVMSPWDSHPVPGTLTGDGKSAMIVAAIKGDENTAPQRARTLADRLPRSTGDVEVQAGGSALVYAEISRQTKSDLIRMEAIAIPLSFAALVWVFGGLLAAALPVAVGGFAILGSLAALRAISLVTDVSIFALNVAVALGFALAVDYTLLIVSRYRDELVDGGSRGQALVRTMTTAGRTVLFSAVTVALALVGMALFPMYFLKSFAYAGVAVVGFAAFAAVAVTPAAIVLAGDRLDALNVRRLLRSLLGRAESPTPAAERTAWYRMAKLVMRHAVPVGVLLTVALLMLGWPFLRVNWGNPDDRVLPPSSSVRAVNDQIRTDFAMNSTTAVKIVLPDTAGLTESDLETYANQLSQVPDVTAVSAPTGTFVDGQRSGPPSAPAGMSADSAFLTVESAAPLYTPASETQLDRLHAVTPPGTEPALLTGAAQTNRDSVQGITSRLPLVLGFIAVVTLILLFLLTGSVVLPIKAVLLNILSLTAAFGALVWIFQEGHLWAAGTTPTGTLAVNIPVLMFCIAFGLSMDYEVFLLSRIREYWLASPRTSRDNDESIALGIERTGRVVTAAALLMTISFAALIFAGVSFMRMFAVGLTIAVLADATVVRMLLVPAFMHVLGRLNWWAPAPLARFHRWAFPSNVGAQSPVTDRRSGQPSGTP
ncbi:MMPL family transporter [Mycobacterium sp. CVI_P3]|uniref:MMPL family transporter n=1 Tax=Mycobacterium pinniadriaticum TaxID=2994102 RepID=A0ABT3SIE4_9MYCO|nr:MMPL family transporter [Mycobacterium pinniadriaticum]MCX2932477.1 MMPL family transporter [Mycobacterium pinniadriaticum]MCX2938889.1 MMPL family transporter [Mycobacterium pinniadriaticum]